VCQLLKKNKQIQFIAKRKKPLVRLKKKCKLLKDEICFRCKMYLSLLKEIKQTNLNLQWESPYVHLDLSQILFLPFSLYECQPSCFNVTFFGGLLCLTHFTGNFCYLIGSQNKIKKQKKKNKNKKYWVCRNKQQQKTHIHTWTKTKSLQ
jgi:hypothetical protein